MSKPDAATTGDGSQAASVSLLSATREWVILAASGTPAAEAYAQSAGIDPRAIISKRDLMAGPRDVRAIVRRANANAAIVHSVDWHRQQNPQLYELALALIPVRERFLVSERDGGMQQLGRVRSAARVALIPLDGIRAAGMIAGVGTRFAWERRRAAAAPAPRPAARSASDWVVVIWPGNPSGFGGSTTHIAGILSGFRHSGFRIALLTRFQPPEQLGDLIDECKVISALAPSLRVNADAEHIGSNVLLRNAGVEMASRLRPAFLYQRHSPFLMAGGEIGRTCQIPLVLEWNSSEVWVRNNWQSQFAIERLLDPLLAKMEREILKQATVVSAVSQEAAEMAVDAGGLRSKVIVLPNAVDVQEVDRCLDGTAPTGDGSSATLGWAGSFGPWHGAEVTVKALAQLPREVRLVMIGDGDTRPACVSLAKTLAVADRIEWTGPVPHDVALRRLAQCDLLVSPHTPLPNQPFFGSPTKIFEYMALSRPIVASRLGQIGEILEDGVSARLVTPGSVDELAQAILEVLHLPDRGRGLGEAARREVVRRHTWNARTQALLARLEHVHTPSANGR